MFNPQDEARPIPELRNLQGERLRALVARAYANVPFYRAKLEAHGVAPEDIRGIEDIVKLPFTVKGIASSIRFMFAADGGDCPHSPVPAQRASPRWWAIQSGY